MNNYIGLAVRRYEENQQRNKKPIKKNLLKRLKRSISRSSERISRTLWLLYKIERSNMMKSLQCYENKPQLEKLLVASKIYSLFYNANYHRNRAGRTNKD